MTGPAHPGLFPFQPDVTKRVIHGFERNWFIYIEDPDSLFLAQSHRVAHGTKHNLITSALQLQRVACRKLEFIAYRLRQYDPPSFING